MEALAWVAIIVAAWAGCLAIWAANRDLDERQVARIADQRARYQLSDLRYKLDLIEHEIGTKPMLPVYHFHGNLSLSSGTWNWKNVTDAAKASGMPYTAPKPTLADRLAALEAKKGGKK